MNNTTVVNKAYEPYIKEGIFCLFQGVLLAILVLLIAFASKIYWLLLNIPLYFISECYLNFRLPILFLCEKKHAWETRTVEITCVKYENSGTVKYGSGSIISKLYPKEQQVGRYKLICKNQSGKKLILRSVMPWKKYKLLVNRLLKEPIKCRISYGKLSHVVFKYESDENWARTLNYIN